MPNTAKKSISSPRHFILAALGSRGDIVPLLWAGDRLRRRGHRITMLANDTFKEDIKARGLGFHSIGTAEEYKAYFSNPKLWKPMEIFSYTTELMKKTAPRFLEGIMAAGGDFDALLNNPFALSAAIVAERLMKPHIVLHPDPFSFWLSADDMPVISENLAFLKKTPKKTLRVGLKMASSVMMLSPLMAANAFRKSLGLLPRRDFYCDLWTGATAHAGLFPEWFARPQADWPKPFKTFGFPLVPSAEPMAPPLKKFLQAGEPPMLWTFGSANMTATEFAGIAAAASRQLKRRALIVTAGGPHGPKAISDDVLWLPRAPFDKVLPSCLAIVHHGGIGTIAQALRAGIPQLLMPLATDQFDNANRLLKLGVAEALSVKKRKAADYALALEKLLGNNGPRLKAKEWREKMLRDNEGEGFVSWVEKQVGSAKPLEMMAG